MRWNGFRNRHAEPTRQNHTVATVDGWWTRSCTTCARVILPRTSLKKHSSVRSKASTNTHPTHWKGRSSDDLPKRESIPNRAVSCGTGFRFQVSGQWNVHLSHLSQLSETTPPPQCLGTHHPRAGLAPLAAGTQATRVRQAAVGGHTLLWGYSSSLRCGPCGAEIGVLECVCCAWRVFCSVESVVQV